MIPGLKGSNAKGALGILHKLQTDLDESPTAKAKNEKKTKDDILKECEK